MMYNKARDWRDYDPTWLVDLAKEQHPNEPDMHTALAACTRAYGDIPYIYFIDSKQTNKLGAEWQIGTSFSLDHPEQGELVVDRMKDGRIGGIEFLGELLKEE
jgi:hypothetical protein